MTSMAALDHLNGPLEGTWTPGEEPIAKRLLNTVFVQADFRCLLVLGLEKWFSTKVPQMSWVPWKALGVPQISEFDIYLLVNCN